MKKLLLGTALASVGFITAANAGSVTIDGITITQVAPFNLGTFDNIPITNPEVQSGTSTAIYNGAPGLISFSTDGGVTQGTQSGISAEPAGDGTHYIWGVQDGTTITFLNGPAYSFLIYWGSIDALTTSTGSTRYDNVLALSNGKSVTGSELRGRGYPSASGAGPGR